MVKQAVKSGLKGESGVVGHDEARKGVLRTIEFPRIKGGKVFDTKAKWFTKMLKDLGQPVGKPVDHGDGH
jgi:diphosphate-dependent phosphofructokinase